MRQSFNIGSRRVLIGAVLAVMLAFAGCGGSDEPTSEKKPTPAAPKAPAAAVPEELVGTWTRRFTRRQLRTLKGPPGNKPGELTLKVQTDGTWEMYLVGSDTADDCVAQATCESGEFEVDDGKLTIGDTVDCVEPAEYSFEAAADKITFHPVKDDCIGDRSAWFGDTTWQRAS